MSDLFARDAWRLLEANYEAVLRRPDDLAARGAMLLGSHQAGVAIEASMLGATHACANPLTARYGTTHGVAIALMLPHVVRWNAEVVGDRYAELLRASGRDPGSSPGEALAARLEALAGAGGLPRSLHDAGVTRDALPELAAGAAKQWTGTFNPRPFDADAALRLYEQAY
jgi:alcohol dehydrogenase